ncbi:hypothetical protein BDQ12DRAFT_681632 [Crucibulum laeve]|uniref:Uncharacterized protein n=1 Tax=Crucibulum laeve TaxID=68775 RepID=A0A5C3M3I6_9AGAR|nr:hypothetical protein BDQ12DRAFT_681632 [Crucibulum laeve]
MSQPIALYFIRTTARASRSLPASASHLPFSVLAPSGVTEASGLPLSSFPTVSTIPTVSLRHRRLLHHLSPSQYIFLLTTASDTTRSYRVFLCLPNLMISYEL